MFAKLSAVFNYLYPFIRNQWSQVTVTRPGVIFHHTIVTCHMVSQSPERWLHAGGEVVAHLKHEVGQRAVQRTLAIHGHDAG